MADIATLGIEVTSGPAVKASSDLDRLTAAAAKAEGRVESLGAAAKSTAAPLAGMSRGFTVAGGGARMMAQQLSQVGQMTMVTGNFAQALAVQLPDIGLAFGAAAGLVAGVALPAIVAAFTNTSSAAKEFKASQDAMSDAVGAFVEAAKAASMPADELIAKYSSLSVAARGALDAIADVKRVEALQAVAAGIKAVNDELLVTTMIGSGRSGQASVRRLADDFGLAADEAKRLEAALIGLEGVQGAEAQARAANEARAALEAAFGSVEKMPPALQAVYGQLANVTVQASTMHGELEKGGNAATLIASALSQVSSLAGGASSAVSGLAAMLREGAAAAWDMASGMAATLQAQQSGGNYDDLLSQTGQSSGPDSVRSKGFGGGAFKAPVRGAGLPMHPAVGGGGGGSDPFAARLEALRAELASEKQVVDDWYAEAIATLQDSRARELMSAQEHKDALYQIEKLYHDQIAELDAQANQQRLSDMGGFFGALAGIAEAGGKRTAKAVATFQAIEGTVNAYGAAIKALNTPGLTIWGRFAAYASVLAAGLKGVAAIRSAGGVGGGGRSAAQAVAPSQGGSQQVEYSIKGIDRDALMTGRMWEMIFDGMFDEGRRRGVPTPGSLRFT